MDIASSNRFTLGKLYVALREDPNKPSPLYVGQIPEIAEWQDGVRRVYFIVNTSGKLEARGGHSHPEKEELMFCPVGSSTLDLRWEGGHTEVTISSPEEYVVIYPGVWHRVITQPGTVLIVLSPHRYSPDEAVDEIPK